MSQYVIGIDLGTGSTKAVATSFDGAVLYATQSYYQGNGLHAMMDPQNVWDAFTHCIRQTIGHLGLPPTAIAFSSAMHSIMAVDPSSKPISPLLTWADDRAAGIAAHLAKQPDGKDFYEHCGTPVHALSPLCKIRWWREQEPSLHQSAAKFIGIKEWIWHKLFGVFEIDYSLASATGMMNLHTKKWYAPALLFAGIGEEKLSQPVDTTFCRKGSAVNIAGMPEASLQGVSFVIGASDGCLANMGTAALQPGTAAITIGTSGAVRVATPAPILVFPEQLFNYYLQEGVWITGGAINNGGAAVQWISRILGHEQVDEGMMETLDAVKAGSEGLLFLPFLMGERAPLWDSNSSAAFVGLQQQHSPAHLLRAVVEGICYALRSVLELLETHSGPVTKLHLSGGFTKSEAALQILADCLGKEVVLLQTADASAIGAALLSLKALNNVAIKNRPAGAEEIKNYYPNAVVHERYNQLYQLYKPLYFLLKSTMHGLRRFS